MRILVADDDPVYRTVIAQHLTKWGFDPVPAEDGLAAWEALTGINPPRLIILDWMMPQKDGYEVCRRLRAEGKASDAFILIVTGSRQKQDIQKVILAGADDYLIKPFDEMDLKIRLRNAVRTLELSAEVSELKKQVQPEAAF